MIGIVAMLSWWRAGTAVAARPATRSRRVHGRHLKSAWADGVLWLAVFAFAVVAPLTEELLARGFLYRGWSESFLRVPGAIVLSSLVWTAMHVQYDLFFLGEVFSIGLVLGYCATAANHLADGAAARP